MAERKAEEKKKLAEENAILEAEELRKFKIRMAEEQAKQLAILEAKANGEDPPQEPSSSSSSSSSSSNSAPPAPSVGGRSRRGRGGGAKVDYVALAAKLNAEKIMREKKAAKRT